MKLSTDCSKCVFAKKSIDGDCELKIIDSIRNIKSIDIKNEYNYINDYVCKYGFSQSRLTELKNNFPDIDIKEYIKIKNLIPYYLVINNLDNKTDIQDICYLIKQLKIQPKGISILTRQNNLIPYIQHCENILGKENELIWRIHNLLNRDLSHSASIHSVMSTNNYTKNSNFIWILNDNQLEYMIYNNIINTINFIVNIIQPDVGIMKSRITDDFIGGLFIDKNVYNRLTANISPELNLAINSIIEVDNIKIINYDEN